MKLLVVDDAAPLRRRIVSAVSQIQAIEVVGNVRHVRGAVQEIGRLRPHVVILDIHLPGGSGICVLESIKHELPPTIVIMFTDLPAARYRRRCATAGANYFFEENLDFARLVRLLAHLAHETPTKTA